ncbi:MAG TPA: hypothetical protein PKI59_03910, partial [Candidatus Cloacimonadota bacterium]|nr:hypothetical protein [Candidatus Cloacimonadota bacterium]
MRATRKLVAFSLAQNAFFADGLKEVLTPYQREVNMRSRALLATARSEVRSSENMEHSASELRLVGIFRAVPGPCLPGLPLAINHLQKTFLYIYTGYAEFFWLPKLESPGKAVIPAQAGISRKGRHSSDRGPRQT